MAVLITGAGLVGARAAALLLERGEQPVLYDVAGPAPWLGRIVDLERVPFVRGDVGDLPDLLAAVAAHRVERIIHSAGLLTAAVRERPFAGVRTNLMGTLDVLEAARLAGLRRVVLCSSSTVLLGATGSHQDQPVPEDFTLRAVSERPRSVYAASKLAAEWIGLNYHEHHGVDFVAVRFTGVLGGWGAQTSGLPGRLLRALVEPLVRGEEAVLADPTILWEGVEDFVHAYDAAAGAILAAFARDPSSRVYHISMGRGYTLAEVLDTARRVFPGARIRLACEPRGGMAGYPLVRRQPASIAAARAELGFEPAYDFERSLREYAAWVEA